MYYYGERQFFCKTIVRVNAEKGRRVVVVEIISLPSARRLSFGPRSSSFADDVCVAIILLLLLVLDVVSPLLVRFPACHHCHHENTSSFGSSRRIPTPPRSVGSKMLPQGGGGSVQLWAPLLKPSLLLLLVSASSGLLFRDDITAGGRDCVIVLEKFARPTNLNCEMEEAGRINCKFSCVAM